MRVPGLIGSCGNQTTLEDTAYHATDVVIIIIIITIIIIADHTNYYIQHVQVGRCTNFKTVMSRMFSF